MMLNLSSSKLSHLCFPTISDATAHTACVSRSSHLTLPLTLRGRRPGRAERHAREDALAGEGSCRAPPAGDDGRRAGERVVGFASCVRSLQPRARAERKSAPAREPSRNRSAAHAGGVELEIVPESAILGAGRGVRVKRAVSKKQLIGSYLGAVSTSHSGSKYVFKVHARRHRPRWVPAHVWRAVQHRKKRLHIDGKPSTGKASLLTRMNHPSGGLKANARFCQDGTVEALCDIEAGAELFASYGASLAQFLPDHSA